MCLLQLPRHCHLPFFLSPLNVQHQSRLAPFINQSIHTDQHQHPPLPPLTPSRNQNHGTTTGAGGDDALPADDHGGADPAAELHPRRGRAPQGALQRVQRRCPGDLAGRHRRRRPEAAGLPEDRRGLRGLGSLPGRRPRRRPGSHRRHDPTGHRVLRPPPRGEAPVRHVRRQEGRLHRLQPPPRGGGAGLEGDRDVLLVPGKGAGLRTVAGQAGGVAGGGGGVQREADGAGVQAAGGAVGGDGPGEGGADDGMRRHGPEGGRQLLSQVPPARPHPRTQAPHRPRHHHTPPPGPSRRPPGNSRRRTNVDHRQARRGRLRRQPRRPRPLSEQREVQERGPPGGGELEHQPAVDRHVPEPGAGGGGVPAGGQGRREAGDGRAHQLRGDVQEEDEQGHRARQPQEGGQGEEGGGGAPGSPRRRDKEAARRDPGLSCGS